MIEKISNAKIVQHFFRDPSALIGAFLLLTFAVGAIFAPVLAPQNPYNLEKVSLTNFLYPPVWMDGGDMPFLLGTDDQGRGILSTILYGCRTSLMVGFGVMLLAGSFGTILGLIAGYYRGILDAIVMRIADVLFSFSVSLTAILVMGLLGGGGVLTVILAISLPEWVKYARTMRGNVLSVREEEYIDAAEASGASDFRIMAKHIMPNSIPSILVVASVELAVVIMLEATLSFLGVGVPHTKPSLGMMISLGRDYIFAGKWWLIVFPGTALTGMVIGINLVADWLRDELNPKSVT
jgi:peptide/nickel transport system permease protein